MNYFVTIKNIDMKKLNSIWIIVAIGVLSSTTVFGQSEVKKNKIIADSKIAKEEFLKTDGLMKGLFEDAIGYVIFPNVG
ncbi:hypothetical protein RCH18_000699 [Flavobacterium sp. PL11]|uniref:hypothetical protein n=1 Tax=Flavobacterium sp. PL11 TaxID=3071717 RepID=UPI002E07BE54|nr:hypothetical protein [Flavobacterium sp. PL11]